MYGLDAIAALYAVVCGLVILAYMRDHVTGRHG